MYCSTSRDEWKWPQNVIYSGFASPFNLFSILYIFPWSQVHVNFIFGKNQGKYQISNSSKLGTECTGRSSNSLTTKSSNLSAKVVEILLGISDRPLLSTIESYTTSLSFHSLRLRRNLAVRTHETLKIFEFTLYIKYEYYTDSRESEGIWQTLKEWATLELGGSMWINTENKIVILVLSVCGH